MGGTLVKMLDDDRSGQVSLDEFIAGCLRLRGNARSSDMIALLYHSQKSHRKVNAILREMRNLHGDMKNMLHNTVSAEVCHEPQGPVASFSPESCPRILTRPADSSEPWIQPWKLGLQ